MRKRTLISLLAALVVLVALGVAFFLRAKAPPEAARLLPESDAILYIHLKDIRNATHFEKTPIARSADFQRFIDATGIDPEVDIDAAALAIHRMADAHGPNGAVAYSEVFEGRFDGVKLARYMASIAAAQETYAGRIIYTVPIEGRQLRIAQLSYDTIGASNMPTTEQIHSMLDRARASAVGTPGSSLLARRYHEVPLLAPVWGIGEIGLPFSSRGLEDAPDNGPNSAIAVGNMQLPLPENTDFVLSLGYTAAKHLLSGGSAELRVEVIAPDAPAAQHDVETLTTLVALARGLIDAAMPHSASASPESQAQAQVIQAVLASIKIMQKDDRAILSANASVEQLKSLTAKPDVAPSNGVAAPEPAPASK